MNILVTGGAGYIGSTLMPLLLDAGYTVTCYDRLMYGITPIKPLLNRERFTLVQADVRDVPLLKAALRQADVIIHLAALVGAPLCAREPEEAQSVNVEGARLVNRLRSGQQRVIYSSTGSVYGRVTDARCTEATPVAPLSAYGRQKATAESFFMEKGNCVSYRYATAFGASPRLRLDLLPNDFTWQAIHNGRIEIYEAGFRRTFLHVVDIARTFIHAVRHFDTMRDQVFNAGHECLNMTKHDLARLIQRYVDYELVTGQGADLDARDYEVDYSRLRATGFAPVVTMDEGIREMVAAFQTLEKAPEYANA